MLAETTSVPYRTEQLKTFCLFVAVEGIVWLCEGVIIMSDIYV